MAAVLPTVPELSPQQRLAISRKAIVRHMQRNDGPKQREGLEDDDYALSDQDSAGGKWGAFKRAARTWWHHHPANVALDLATPVVGDYARKHPFKVLGIAAGVGAVAIVLKPWRLVSLGGILLATMKSSDITGMVLSMLTPSPHDTENQPENNQSK